MNRLIPLFLAACATQPSEPPSPAEFAPFEIGRQWNYELRLRGYVPEPFAARVGGSDVRDLDDEERVDFIFVYGRPGDADHNMTKSIYAMASDGPREFYFDTLSRRLKHEPPIPLLPSGIRSTWEGTVSIDRKPTKTTARIEVTALEGGDQVRTVTTYEAIPLKITRWFGRGKGLVRVELQERGEVTLELVSR
ncbi:MAG: hypothetical protein ACYS0E_21815 [Planctomycetota bacterium]|jgi:hypothetical protein